MVALRGTVRRHALDLQPFHDLLSAFRQDQMVARYQDDQHVLDYCRRSANPVGRILLQLADTRDDNCISWSDSICTGLQIANFCQDMARDASNHRVYLPQSRWAEAAVEESEFFSGQASPGKLRALEAWCSLANQYLRSGWPLQTQVPAWLARGVRVFVGGGLAILENIAQQGFDVWTHRPVVSRLQKLRILVRACFLGRIPQPRAHTYRKGISNYPISTNDSEKGISQT
jgi:squalene synthase HpnC